MQQGTFVGLCSIVERDKILTDREEVVMDRKVGERIRELREIQHYTRECFAEKIDISSKFLYDIETGKKGFSAEVLVRISKALSVSCEYIMIGEEVGNRGNEKIICVLEKLQPKQKNQMQNIVKLLCDLCDTF